VRIVQVANFYAPTSGGLRTCLDEIGRRYQGLGRRRAAGWSPTGPRPGSPAGCGRCWTCRRRTGGRRRGRRPEQFPWSATVDGLLAAHGVTRALAG
jgi:hypothetical protein